MPTSDRHEAKLTVPLLIIFSMPSFISGIEENYDKVLPLHVNNQEVSSGANDTINDNQNITQTSGIEAIDDVHPDERLPKEVDHFFLLIMSIIIFFMQCGFAFMEAGAVRYVKVK